MPDMPRPRVLLLIPHLGGGGAERVMSLQAQGLSGEKYEVHLGLVTTRDAGPESFPPGVTLHTLGAAHVRWAGLPLLRLIWQVRPAVILAGMFHLNFLVLLLRPLLPAKTRVLVRQNGTVSSALAFGGLPRVTRILYRLLYRRADCVLCQTGAMAADLALEAGVPQSRLAVVPNPVNIEQVRGIAAMESTPWPGPGPHLLAVSRLSREKGLDLLLSALAVVRKEFPEADLVIAGTGAEEDALRAQARGLQMDAAVRFAGHIPCPWVCFGGATLFVLPSRHEGLPNALLEAAAAGLPIVATPASQGLVDLLRGQPGVWLPEALTADALAASLLAALSSMQPSQRFPHSFVDGYEAGRALSVFERIIDEQLANMPC